MFIRQKKEAGTGLSGNKFLILKNKGVNLL